MQQIRLDETTAVLRRIPLFLLDVVDGETPKTALEFAAADIQVSKNGAAEANSAGTVTEVAGGLYYYTATAGEVDTAGFLTLRVVHEGVVQFVALTQVTDITTAVVEGILAEVATDQDIADLIRTTGVETVDTVVTLPPVELDESALNDIRTEVLPLAIADVDYPTGTVVEDGGNTASAFLTDLAVASENTYKDRLIRFTGGALAGQVRKITASITDDTDTLITVSSAFTETPGAAGTFVLIDR